MSAFVGDFALLGQRLPPDCFELDLMRSEEQISLFSVKLRLVSFERDQRDINASICSIPSIAHKIHPGNEVSLIVERKIRQSCNRLQA